MSDLDEARAIRYFLDAFCDRDTIGLALSQELYPVPQVTTLSRT